MASDKTTLGRLETLIRKWLKPLPNMPAKNSKWLSENIWWIIAIVAGLLALAAVANINEILKALEIQSRINKMLYYSVLPVFGARVWIPIATKPLSLVFLIIATAINTMAIIPLKEKKKRGWDLLFLMLIIMIVSMFINIIINFNIFNFIPTLLSGTIFLAGWAYLLLQVKSYFIKITK